jgi:hypothetical protein
MSEFIDVTTNSGTGWFNPDPTNIANYVNNPADSFMVYVGSPTENAYDTNRRWISEILDYAQPLRELFSAGGKYPAVSADTLINRAYAGIQPVGGVIRVVFRVKTNRVRADGIVGTATSYNSKDGAAVLDQVQVDAARPTVSTRWATSCRGNSRATSRWRTPRGSAPASRSVRTSTSTTSRASSTRTCVARWDRTRGAATSRATSSRRATTTTAST